MAWRIKILPAVRGVINGLWASGALSRAGWIHVQTALYFQLPTRARRLQSARYAMDPDCFVYEVRFYEHGVWHRFNFFVNDSLSPGLLSVQDTEYKSHR